MRHSECSVFSVRCCVCMSCIVLSLIIDSLLYNMFERVLRADVCAQSPSNNPGEEKKEGEGGGSEIATCGRGTLCPPFKNFLGKLKLTYCNHL